MGEGNTVCSACGKGKSKGDFTKAQLKKNATTRKCKDCTDTPATTDIQQSMSVESTVSSVGPSKTTCCVCGQGKDKEGFSKAQLKKSATSRKCKDCVAAEDQKGGNPAGTEPQDNAGVAMSEGKEPPAPRTGVEKPMVENSESATKKEPRGASAVRQVGDSTTPEHMAKEVGTPDQPAISMADPEKNNPEGGNAQVGRSGEDKPDKEEPEPVTENEPTTDVLKQAAVDPREDATPENTGILSTPAESKSVAVDKSVTTVPETTDSVPAAPVAAKAESGTKVPEKPSGQKPTENKKNGTRTVAYTEAPEEEHATTDCGCIIL